MARYCGTLCSPVPPRAWMHARTAGVTSARTSTVTTMSWTPAGGVRWRRAAAAAGPRPGAGSSACGSPAAAGLWLPGGPRATGRPRCRAAVRTGERPTPGPRRPSARPCVLSERAALSALPGSARRSSLLPFPLTAVKTRTASVSPRRKRRCQPPPPACAPPLTGPHSATGGAPGQSSGSPAATGAGRILLARESLLARSRPASPAETPPPALSP